MTEPDSTRPPPKKILLATDLSARCDRALDRAVALAATWQAELVVVHAMEQTDDFYATVLEERLPSWRRLSDPAAVVAEQMRRDMLQAAPNVVTIAEKGEPDEVVLQAAKKHGCDLIVTGIARDETLGRFGLGTTVDRLLRRSRLPVLVVKERVRAPYANIVVATDFSSSSREALRVAAGFFPERKLHLFHGFEPPGIGLVSEPDRYREQCRQSVTRECASFLAGAGLPADRTRHFGLIIEEGDPGDLIRQYVRDRGADLVVLGTQGRSALADLFLGSTARNILSSLPCDALAVREPDAPAEGERAAAR
ncbi:MAG: universal stress protein [Reyranellaceae bacterium]